MLFTAGLFSAQTDPFAPLWLLVLLVPVAAFGGDQLGYYLGRRTGPAIYRRPDSRWFKQRYVRQSKEFFERHGARTVLPRSPGARASWCSGTSSAGSGSSATTSRVILIMIVAVSLIPVDVELLRSRGRAGAESAATEGDTA